MAKIKHTKNELKNQQDALARFERYLPMLQLKKQQLQVEIQNIEAAIHKAGQEEQKARQDIENFVELFSSGEASEDLVTLTGVQTEEGNIAGVAIPVLQDVKTKRKDYSLFETPPWIDDAADLIEKLIRLRLERQTLEEQLRLISDELRTTTQRVNLFEKVKIPESRENIRVIKIFLGDQQTAGVIRAKIAKSKIAERAA
ncbi:MAG: V-type ATP synthase subunit D [Verrucomicrobiota bacterium]